MSEGMTAQQFVAEFTRRAFDGILRGIEDLTPDELHARPHEDCNSIGFDAWHIFRTADNVVFFVFEREQPVWLQQDLHERWGLPKVDQGTGMDPADAHALRFPDAEQLAGYGRDVLAAVLPRIEAMSDEYLQTTTRVVPWGEVTRLEALGQTIVTHANQHLGHIDQARSMLGKSGLGV